MYIAAGASALVNEGGKSVHSCLPPSQIFPAGQGGDFPAGRLHKA